MSGASDDIGEAATLPDDAKGNTPGPSQPLRRTAADEVEPARVFAELFQQDAEPRKLGRYAVLGTLGQGGMGVVLRAYDRELDRPVALKVLHRELGQQHTIRLRREAQAMAKLSHPNVVQVYEVGEIDGQTFVAMELVTGKTVHEWLRRAPPPDWRACVRLFVQLGAGLAAAHERGLVHRDFKPGNAIIDDKGRARVLDFGLARQGEGNGGADDDPTLVSQQVPGEPEPVPLDVPLTSTGAVLGTPAYMPPEQMSGRQVDARSDQFSFCVSLHEAVYGTRPYEGSSMAALMVSMTGGSVRPPPKRSKVPAALRKVLLRGLAIDPAQRWPSMEALLERLRSLVAPRRGRFIALAVGVGLLAIGGGLGADRFATWASRCSGARSQLDGIWDEERKQAVEAAILGTELVYASGTWERVQPRLDEYAEAWITEHTEVCEATAVRGEQSEEVQTLRMACLHERRSHLRATVDVLARADAEVVERAVQTVASLPTLSRCADVEALAAEIPPPEDPAVAERVEALDEQLIAATAASVAGKAREGLAAANAVVAEAEQIDYEPLRVRAWLRQGELEFSVTDYPRAATTLRRAFDAALARRMMPEATYAALRLVDVLGHKLAQQAAARRWAELTDPLSRATGTDDARARYLGNLATLAHAEGKYDEARSYEEQVLTIYENAPEPNATYVGSTLGFLGIVAQAQGKLDDAHDFFARALAIYEKALGPDHPSVATARHGLGNVAQSQGKLDEARDLHQRALASFETTLGPDHPKVASALHGLGDAAKAQGKLDEARDCYARALAISEKTYGSEHPSVASLLNNLGNLTNLQGKPDEARDFYTRALTAFEKTLGPDHPNVGLALNNLGFVAQSQGKLDDARDFHQRALAIFEKALGPDHPNVGIALANLGIVATSRGELDDARDFLERALAIWEKALGPEHPNVARVLGNLGDVAELQGRLDEAHDFQQRSLAIRERVLGPEHSDVAASLHALGNVARLRGALAEARDLQQRALAIQEQALGPEHPEVAHPLCGLGNVLIDLAKPTEALPLLERALVLRTTHAVDPSLVAKTRFLLARASWAAPSAGGRDRPRARELAEQARDAWAGAGPGRADDLAEVEQWLAEHRVR